MQEVETRRGYLSVPAVPAWPASSLRWGAVLGGAVTLLSVSLLLWGLAFAITVIATSPLASSTRASGLALWICAMVVTVIGAIAGGWFAGRSISGAPRAWGAAHGFAAWTVSLLFSFFLFRDAVTEAVFQGIGGEESAASLPRADSEHAARLAHDYFVAASWSWVVTWLVAGLAAAAAGAIATNWTRRSWKGPTIETKDEEQTIEGAAELDRPLTRSPAQ